MIIYKNVNTIQVNVVDMFMFSAQNVYFSFFLIFTARMSEGDSVGESIHGKPSVVYAFFTRIGQVK